ncbi:hypothetical protein G3N95_01210 [Paraburkholderia sp. Tr-20389]|uniref:hypothetical protein n=1 Tax=Paraburkholderia sp. Tr-20389 TaxID=2703903 RepID=UPI00197DFDF5|nr:hypothetical protein [Paraburkholderia sp. Tr-20389]MBN3751544.1 hypothetical protein [Paraburkholderia sp. Tr-20389]
MPLLDPLFLLLAFDAACIAFAIAVLVNMAIFHVLSTLLPGHSIAECWTLFAPKDADHADSFVGGMGEGGEAYIVELHVEHADM